MFFRQLTFNQIYKLLLAEELSIAEIQKLTGISIFTIIKIARLLYLDECRILRRKKYRRIRLLLEE